MTSRARDSRYAHHFPPPTQVLSPLYLSARLIGTFDFSKLNPTPSFLPVFSETKSSRTVELEDCRPSLELDRLNEGHWENDGVVPAFSQWHPNACRFTKCVHLPSDKSVAPTPGTWLVSTINDASHISLVPLWMGTLRQRIFWGQVGDWLTRIDSLCSINRQL